MRTPLMPANGADHANNPFAPIERRFTFTATQLASALQLSPSTVRQRCERNEIEATKHGRLWRIPRREYFRLVGVEGAAHEDGSGSPDILRENERLKECLRRMAREIQSTLEG